MKGNGIESDGQCAHTYSCMRLRMRTVLAKRDLHKVPIIWHSIPVMSEVLASLMTSANLNVVFIIKLHRLRNSAVPGAESFTVGKLVGTNVGF